jgi:hypothetical protein
MAVDTGGVDLLAGPESAADWNSDVPEALGHERRLPVTSPDELRAFSYAQ